MQDHDEYILSTDISSIDWWRLANIMAEAHLFDRKPFDIARAFHGSFASVFAFQGDMLIGAARATSDGVFYATVFDVVVAPENQGQGVGRLVLEGLLDQLPFDRVYLTSTSGNEPFYAKFGFLQQTNAMGRYTGNALTSAIQRGVLRHAAE